MNFRCRFAHVKKTAHVITGNIKRKKNKKELTQVWGIWCQNTGIRRDSAFGGVCAWSLPLCPEAMHCNIRWSRFPFTLASFLTLPDARIPPIFRDMIRLWNLRPCEIHGPAVQVRCWWRPERWIRTPKWNLREGRTRKVNEFLEEVPPIRPYFHGRV